MKSLKGKNIVITGCNRGIGRAILEKYVEYGCNIYAVVRKISSEFAKSMEELEERYEVKIHPLSCDFSLEDEVRDCAKKILLEKVKLDVLVNNVGVSYPANIFNMTKINTIKKCFQINFFSPLEFTQLLSKNMIRNKGGKIIFISSTAAFDGGNNIEYTTSKAAINGAVKRLSIEYGQYNIDVNAIAPGFTDTDMGASQKEELFHIAMERSIKKRMARPEEIAEIALFLGSGMSSYITGQIIRADGGMS